jgi:cation diffusion facilitator family transporter
VAWLHASFSRIPPDEVRGALLSVGVSVLLTSLKFLAYYLTGSAAIFSDAMESIVHVLASSFAFYALAVAHTPPDEEHPYGHGKVEFFSAGFEGGMILLAAVVIVIRTLDALLFHPLEIEKLGVGLALITFAMLANGAVGLVLIRLGNRHHSATLRADGYHLLSDAITTVAALVALLLMKAFGWRLADPIIALLIGLYIAYLGLKLMRQSVEGLMDRQDAGDERMLKTILESHLGPAGQAPTICSYHKLRHRHSGRYHWVDLHIMVPAGRSVEQGHAVASAIEFEIQRALVQANATAHVEPCHDANCAHCLGE